VRRSVRRKGGKSQGWTQVEFKGYTRPNRKETKREERRGTRDNMTDTGVEEEVPE